MFHEHDLASLPTHEVEFTDGATKETAKVPACYYEFAKRYARPDGVIFGGFVAKSADKILESTNRKA